MSSNKCSILLRSVLGCPRFSSVLYGPWIGRVDFPALPFASCSQRGDECQTEEVADENKSLIWALVKQVSQRHLVAAARSRRRGKLMQFFFFFPVSE